MMETVRRRMEGAEAIARQLPPMVGLHPSINGGVTLEVCYRLKYRQHDQLEDQATLGRQIDEAILAGPQTA